MPHLHAGGAQRDEGAMAKREGEVGAQKLIHKEENMCEVETMRQSGEAAELTCAGDMTA